MKMNLRLMLPALLLALFSGCALFNALYNGREAYKKALDNEERMLIEGRDSLEIQKANEKDYKRAIEKAEKTITAYPKSVRYHDDAWFLKGMASYKNRDYSVAVRSFTVLQESFKDSKYIPESWLYLGKSYQALRDFENANACYALILEKYPHLNKNMEISLLLAEIAGSVEGKGQAVRILENLFKDAKTDVEKVLIIQKLSSHYASLKLYKKALSWLDKLPSFTSKEVELYYSCEYTKVEVLRELDMLSEAEEFLKKILKRNEYFNHINALSFLLGTVYERQDRVDEAYDTYQEITGRDGDDIIIARSFFAMAGISLDIRGDLEKGKEELESAKERAGKDKELRAAIEKKLMGLESIVRLRDTVDGDNKDSIDFDILSYRIAEAFWFEVALYDSAIAIYDSLLEDTTLADSLRALSMYSKAYLYREFKNDTLYSDSLFNEIIFLYPSSEVAKESQKVLDIPITVVTRRDSAIVGFTKAEAIERDSVTFNKQAYYLYLITARKYPEVDDVAARALYAAGIEVNKRPSYVDGVVDTAAAKIFTRLCQEYPESEQCKDAQVMLKGGGAIESFVSSYEALLEDRELVDSLEAETSGDTTFTGPRMPTFEMWF